MTKAFVVLLGVCLLFPLLEDCGTKGSAGNKGPLMTTAKLATGTWGGQHIQAEVSDRGAQFEFDCGQGVIEQPIVLDRKGRFELAGRYFREHGGPSRNDEENKGITVSYSGAVRDSELSLTITNPATKESLGNYALTLGSEGNLMKCR